MWSYIAARLWHMGITHGVVMNEGFRIGLSVSKNVWGRAAANDDKATV